MEPSRLIVMSKFKFILVFEDVREGDSFLDYKPFTQDSDIAYIHCDSVRKSVEYSNREELGDFISSLDATNNRVMSYHAAFSLHNMPNMKHGFLCSWQHMYHLILFTVMGEPYQIMIRTRRNEKDSLDSMRELSEEFLQESYENHGIELKPIVQENGTENK